MNKNILYTLAILFVSILSSCVEKELFEPELKQPEDNGPIVFAASLKGFKETALGTRAGEDVFIPEMFENTIYNALFMMFDHAGILRVKGNATVDSDTGMVSYNIGRDALSVFPKFTICFLANVSEDIYDDFVVNETTWNALQNYYYSVSYALYSETGTVGVPNKADLNGDGVEEYALPMFGSKEVTSPYNSAADYYTFEMERLFARIDIKLSLGIEADGNIFTSEPQFSLMDCTVNNIPTGIPIAKKDGATAYATNDDSSLYATGELTSFTNFEYIIYTGREDSLYFYVPEHKLALESSSQDPKNKPNLVSGNMKPIYAAISGFLSDNTDTYETTYNIYLGENSYNNFDLKRNTRYINHVSIKGVADSLIDHRVEIDKMEEMVDDLGEAGKTANCYIIEGNGTYMLSAYRGAYTLPDPDAEMCSIGINRVLYCDNPNIQITIDERMSKQSTIVFKVEGVTTGGWDVDPKKGNAIIARINNEGEIDWSWHLWIVGNNSFSFGGDLDLGDWTSGVVNDQSLPDGSTKMMDRNLGVLSTVNNLNTGTDLGLFYQYGKKEPYLNGEYLGGGSLDISSSWTYKDNKKSPTDPCPVGYRVPSSAVWQGTNDTNATKEHYAGRIIKYALGGVAILDPKYENVSVLRYWDGRDDIYYPYSGYLNGGNVEKDLGLDTDRTIYHANDFTISELTTEPLYTDQSPPVSSMNVLQTEETETETKTYEYTEYQYLNFDYAMYMNTLDVGYLWTSDNAYFRYSHTDNNNWNGFEIIKCDYQSRTITQKQKRTRTRTRTWYIFGYGSWSPWSSWSDWSWDSNSITRSSWSPSTSVTNSDNNAPMIGNINNEDWRNRLIQNQSSRNLSGGTKIKQFSTAPTVGYQVRCVKE